MRDYELTMVLNPKATDEDTPSYFEKVTEYITEKGGVVSDVNHWGRRRLAYPIDKFMEGDYVLARVQLEPEWIPDMEADWELTEDVLRYLVIRIED